MQTLCISTALKTGDGTWHIQSQREGKTGIEIIFTVDVSYTELWILDFENIYMLAKAVFCIEFI